MLPTDCTHEAQQQYSHELSLGTAFMPVVYSCSVAPAKLVYTATTLNKHTIRALHAVALIRHGFCSPLPHTLSRVVVTMSAPQDEASTVGDSDTPSLDVDNLHKLTVPKLKAALDERHVEYPKKALKQELIDRLHGHLAADAASAKQESSVDGEVDSNRQRSSATTDARNDSTDTVEYERAENDPTTARNSTDTTAVASSNDTSNEPAIDSRERRHSKRRKVDREERSRNDDDAAVEADVPDTSNNAHVVSHSLSTDAAAGADTDTHMTHSADASSDTQFQATSAATVPPSNSHTTTAFAALSSTSTSPHTDTAAAAPTSSVTVTQSIPHKSTVPAPPRSTAATSPQTSQQTAQQQHHQQPQQQSNGTVSATVTTATDVTANKYDKSSLSFYNYTPRDPELRKQCVNVIDIESGKSPHPLCMSPHQSDEPPLVVRASHSGSRT